MAIITRAGKGSALTHAELDTNITENMLGGLNTWSNPNFSFSANTDYALASMDINTIRARWTIPQISLSGGPASFYAYVGGTSATYCTLVGAGSRIYNTGANTVGYNTSSTSMLVSSPTAYQFPSGASFEIERSASTYSPGVYMYFWRFFSYNQTNPFLWFASGRVTVAFGAYVTGIGFRVGGYGGTIYGASGYSQK